MLNSLTSPEARGAFDIVAQEEAPNKTIPLNKRVINIDLMEMDLLPLSSFLFSFHLPINYPHHLKKLLLGEYPFLNE